MNHYDQVRLKTVTTLLEALRKRSLPNRSFTNDADYHALWDNIFDGLQQLADPVALYPEAGQPPPPADPRD